MDWRLVTHACADMTARSSNLFVGDLHPMVTKRSGLWRLVTSPWRRQWIVAPYESNWLSKAAPERSVSVAWSKTRDPDSVTHFEECESNEVSWSIARVTFDGKKLVLFRGSRCSSVTALMDLLIINCISNSITKIVGVLTHTYYLLCFALDASCKWAPTYCHVLLQLVASHCLLFFWHRYLNKKTRKAMGMLILFVEKMLIFYGLYEDREMKNQRPKAFISYLIPACLWLL